MCNCFKIKLTSPRSCPGLLIITHAAPSKGRRTFGRLDALESGGEELEEGEVVDVGREVAHPHRVVLLAGHEARALVVQLEADGLQEIRNL